MRYLTKQLIESWNFHNFPMSDNMEKDVDDYCSAFSDKILDGEEKYSIFAQSYQDWIKYRYKSGIYKEDVVRKIIYDVNGDLKPIDETIYRELGELKLEFKNIFDKEFKKVFENKEIIKSGKFPRKIKKLAELNRHDAHVSFEKSGNNRLDIMFRDFGASYDERCIFDLVNNENIVLPDLSLYDNVKVLYEELLLCDNNIFEYNILLEKWKSPSFAYYQEISILFSKVDVKRIKSGAKSRKFSIL